MAGRAQRHCAGTVYAPAGDPLATLARPIAADISVYARNRDYHDVIKGRLKHLAQFIVARVGPEVKVFVDTAPVMEKPLARAPGWAGRGSTPIWCRGQHGSWLLLGEIYTTLEIPADAPHADRCGTCTRCLTFVRRMPSRRPTGWMRRAASPI